MRGLLKALVFGVSFAEIAVLLVVTLVVVGPQKLPKMLGTLGHWIRKVRQLTMDMRAQTGIDEILREEGLQGGIQELRSILRMDLGRMSYSRAHPAPDPYLESDVSFDPLREYPPEGVDAYGALPDDLIDENAVPAQAEPAPKRPETSV